MKQFSRCLKNWNIGSLIGNWKLEIGNSPNGSVLLLAMLILSSVLAASTAVGTLIVREIRANRQVDDAVIAYYAAESATEKGLWLETQPGSTLTGLQLSEELFVTGSTTSLKVARQATRKDTKIIIPLIPRGKNIIVDLYKPDAYIDGAVTGDLGAGVDTLTVVKSGGALTIACQARRGGPTGQTAVTCPAELSQTMNTDTWTPTLDSSLAYRFTLTAGATEDVRNITFSGKLSGNNVSLPTPLTILGKGTLPSSRQGVSASLTTSSPLDQSTTSSDTGGNSGGTTCVGSANIACAIDHGTGIQIRVCDTSQSPPQWVNQGACSATSCDVTYHPAGALCVQNECPSGGNERSCTSQPQNTQGGKEVATTCDRTNDPGTWVNFGACTGWTCSIGYVLQGDQCVQGTTWTQTPTVASWSARRLHTAVVFNNKIWVMGGNAGGLKNDVWSSSDGTTWTQTPTVASWSARAGHTAVVFNNKIWVMGGYDNNGRNDVWSFNGTTWTPAPNASWSARSGHTAMVFNNKMWVMGGFGLSPKNDVWSFNGTTWTPAPNASWSARSGHAAVVFNNKIWVMGGNAGGLRNDVWSSPDGVTWTQTPTVASWSARFVHTSVVLDNKIWVMGGGGLLGTNKNDVWSSP